MVAQLDPFATESRLLLFAPEFLTRHRLSGRGSSAHSALEVNVAVTYGPCGILVVNSRVTFRTANDTRPIVGEAETLGKVNPQGSDDVTS